MELQDFQIVLEGCSSPVYWYSFSLEGLGYHSRYSMRLKGQGRFFFDSDDFAPQLTVRVKDSIQSVHCHGELLCFEQKFVDEGCIEIELVIGCSLHRLDNLANERVYYQKNVVEIIQSLLADAAIEADFDCQEQYLPQAYIAQGGVSDYDFLLRLCSEFGLFFYYRQESNRARLCFVDISPEGSEHKLAVVSPAGFHDSHQAIFSFTEQQISLADEVSIRGTNELNSVDIWEVKQNNSTEISGNGAFELFDYQSFRSEQELSQKAFLLQQQLDWQRQLYLIETSSTELQPGDILHINQAGEVESKSYQVFDVSCYFQQTESGQKTFFSRVWLLPVYCRFKPLCSETQSSHLTVQQPRLPEAIFYHYQKPNPVFKMAKIVGQDSSKSELDELGRYKIRLLFDDDISEGNWHYVRQIQPLAGVGKSQAQGMHFPLKPGVRVVIGHLDGQIDKPFIIGCLPDKTQPSPVNGLRSESLLFQNPEGAGFEWSEREKNRQSLCFYTEKSTHGLDFSVEEENESVRISSLDNMSLQAEKTLSSTQQGAQMLSDSFALETENELGLISEKDLNFRSGQDIRVHSGQNCLLKSQEGMTTYRSKEDIHFEGKSLHLSASSLQISGQYADIYSGKEFNLQVGQSFFLRCEQSALSLVENSIVFNSEQLTIEAQEVKKHQGGVMNSSQS